MTFLSWGCEPLAAECESCLNAICNACNEGFRKGDAMPDGFDATYTDAGEPDCDHCDLEERPDCQHCDVIFDVCRACSRNADCEFRITEQT